MRKKDKENQTSSSIPADKYNKFLLKSNNEKDKTTTIKSERRNMIETTWLIKKINEKKWQREKYFLEYYKINTITNTQMIKSLVKKKDTWVLTIVVNIRSIINLYSRNFLNIRNPDKNEMDEC